MKSTLDRRDFMKCSALTLTALWLTACTPHKDELAVGANSLNYYLTHREALLEDVEPLFKALRNQLMRDFPEDRARQISEQTRQRFTVLLETLPDIGCDRNSLTPTLVQSAFALAFYQIMKQENVDVEECGRIMYLAVRSMILAPEVMGEADTRRANSQAARDYYRQGADFSQKRQYPEDWVYSYVEGDGESFDYGVNYQECAICKYFKSQNAFELARYLCLGDFPISQRYETGLVRTTTLANGDSCCDFRFKAGRAPQIEWMPEFLMKGS